MIIDFEMIVEYEDDGCFQYQGVCIEQFGEKYIENQAGYDQQKIKIECQWSTQRMQHFRQVMGSVCGEP